MSYDKLKSLVANVEAIETAMKIKVQGRTATQEEKAVLSRFRHLYALKKPTTRINTAFVGFLTG